MSLENFNYHSGAVFSLLLSQYESNRSKVIQLGKFTREMILIRRSILYQFNLRCKLENQFKISQGIDLEDTLTTEQENELINRMNLFLDQVNPFQINGSPTNVSGVSGNPPKIGAAGKSTKVDICDNIGAATGKSNKVDVCAASGKSSQVPHLSVSVNELQKCKRN